MDLVLVEEEISGLDFVKLLHHYRCRFLGLGRNFGPTGGI
jgi:hypothetical protein